MRAGFWEFPAPGWWLQWGAQQEARRQPSAAIRVVSPAAGALCGVVPIDWDGQVVTMVADDGKCGLGAN